MTFADRPRPPLVPWLVGAILLASLAGAGCASTPATGVQPDYRSASIRGSALLPFFARGTYSLGRDAVDKRLEVAQRTAVRWLRDRGVGVQEPERSRELLREAEVEAPMASGGRLRVDLSTLLESADNPQRRQLHRRALRAVGEVDRLRRYLLLGELLYHTVTQCRDRADAYDLRARVVVVDDAKRSFPRPCIVTHFQARLVDTRKQQTVWFNRTFRELHPDEISTKTVARNIRAAVRTTLEGSGGLGSVVGASGGSE